jgi:hypothetical protein
MKPNPYTCRLLRRVDKIIWKLRGKRVYWSSDGHLCERYPAGHGGELDTHFPGWMYVAAAKVQNRWFWTRKVLSA